MRQILQALDSGETMLAEVPCPAVRPGHLLIQSAASLVSIGTERMLVEFGKASLPAKARQQPEKVRQVLDKLRTDGLLPTLDAVRSKLDQPIALGYSNAGSVLAVGADVEGFRVGDRVVSNGPHAEVVCVPRNLCAKVPGGVTDEQAAFTVVGSIALQGVRLARPTLGERVVVFGVGLVGLLVVQFLRASGCEVLAVDPDPARLAKARGFGAQTADLALGADPAVAAQSWTGGAGVDAAIITASAKSSEIVHQAAEACRKRGRIVLVGVVGLNLRRSDFYEKELTFQVSCSYGPGRYDEQYEREGHDYPIGHVRWTEQRNFQAVLAALAAKRLHVDPLITHRYALADAALAYETMQNDHSAIGVVLKYPAEVDRSASVVVAKRSAPASAKPVVGVIGAGQFATSTLLPALRRTPADVAYVAVSSNSAAAYHAAHKFGIRQATTDYREILDDPEVNAVFVLTGHDSHARFVCEALQAGKHVYVEKPLAINEEGLSRITEAVASAPHRLLMVGFNRRYSSHVTKMKDLLAGRSGPLCMNMVVNAGAIPAGHWLQDPTRGGGRVVGEACHFIDLLSFLADSPVVSVSAVMVGEGPAVHSDKTGILLAFVDGSIGTVNYYANGPKSYPKERLEVFSDGRVLALDNFRVTKGYGIKGFRTFRTWRQDKGHRAEVAAFVECVAGGGEALIPFAQLANVTRASLAAAESARTGRMVKL